MVVASLDLENDISRFSFKNNETIRKRRSDCQIIAQKIIKMGISQRAASVDHLKKEKDL